MVDSQKRINPTLTYCLSVFFYVVSDSFIKRLSYDFDITEIIFYRAFFGLIIIIVLASSYHYPVYKINSLKIMTLRCLLSFLTFYMSIVSLKGISLHVYNTYYHLSPLFSYFFAIVFLKEKLNFKTLVLLGFAIIGVYLSAVTDSGGILKFKIYALITSILWALSITSLKKLSNNDSASSIVFYSYLFNFITGLFIFDIKNYFCYKYLVISILSIFHLAGFYLMVVSLKKLKLSHASQLEYTGIVWALLIGYFIWEETVDYKIIIGASMIIVSSFYIYKLNLLKNN